MAGAFAAPVSAEEGGIPGEFSANVALTSDYKFRGVTQSSSDPAIQGGFDYGYGIFYAGVWASSIDFEGTTDPLELDLYAGIAPTVAGIDLDLGVLYYAYPGASDDGAELDYWEFYGGAGYDFGPLGVSGYIYYSPDYTGETGDTIYYTAGVSVPITDSFSADANIGTLTFIDETDETANATDWNLGVTYTYEQFSFDLRYVDIDDEDLDDESVVFTMGASF